MARNNLLVVLLILVVVAVVFSNLSITTTTQSNTGSSGSSGSSGSGGDSGSDIMSVRFYDYEGNLINSIFQTGAIVDGVNVDDFDLTVKVTNVGNKNLNCRIDNVSPALFNNAISKTTKSVSPGGTVSWTSARIDANTFSGQNTFIAGVVCNDGTQDISRTGSITLTFN